ncbi:hypothetical protein BGZ80_001544 [Entomortierella chlamydospora]|uniref:Uncharacterized protein n=1 Tax=Entomortierella chlamydospora TaxID=101097 RepID=A0A9P6SXP9_9FUNG|nr:hypothetical protein BGZ79_003743 [Entomortierella chlamydospora]KAG0010371.1 hypothetical protein BGZ80_001544 [Entomortierella chlamydospora]
MSTLLFFLVLLSFTSFHIYANAVPINKNEPFRFDITSPRVDTEWLTDSLSPISWDTSLIPSGSTMDVALLQHAKKRSILLRRYIPAQQGTIHVNLSPEIEPGMYSLLLTVYKGRTSSVIARSFVSSLLVVDEVQKVVQSVDTSTLNFQDKPINILDSSTKDSKIEMLHFTKDLQEAILDDEPVQLTNESGGRSLVLMAPYTIGWTIPKALKRIPRTRVNILLVSKDSDLDDSVKIVRALKTNIDARVGFQYVFLPKDLPRNDLYQIRIEIYGNGRKFVGYTHQFSTQLPAFVQEQ